MRPVVLAVVVLVLNTGVAASERPQEALSVSGHANVPAPPLPRQQWDASARVWLARAVFGEGGNAVDEAAIPWALLRRWQASAPRMRWSFRTLVRRYCSPVRADLATWDRLLRARDRGDAGEVRKVQRRRWIQRLPWAAGPEHWRAVPEGARGQVYSLERWRRVRATVEAWGRGEVADPCPGADHWDEPRSLAWVRLRRVRCSSPPGNAFYASAPTRAHESTSTGPVAID